MVWVELLSTPMDEEDAEHQRTIFLALLRQTAQWHLNYIPPAIPCEFLELLRQFVVVNVQATEFY
jgi:hypothetical protein